MSTISTNNQQTGKLKELERSFLRQNFWSTCHFNNHCRKSDKNLGWIITNRSLPPPPVLKQRLSPKNICPGVLQLQLLCVRAQNHNDTYVWLINSHSQSHKWAAEILSCDVMRDYNALMIRQLYPWNSTPLDRKWYCVTLFSGSRRLISWLNYCIVSSSEIVFCW